uniref:Uncharacterized protein n=1 Tax=Arundo donax TaxID=35708 RepID=A0A0A8Y4U6_ARUDO
MFYSNAWVFTLKLYSNADHMTGLAQTR